MRLSIVSTLFKSEKYISEFVNRISLVANNITNDYEIIFVNDGSPDNSLIVALNEQKKNSKIKIIELSRNFGHHYAIMAGLNETQGEYVFLIDCDLEEDPELLIQFWKRMQDDKEIDVLYGVQAKRKGGLFEKISGAIFWKLFDFLTGVNLEKNPLTVRLMVKNYVNKLAEIEEKNLFLAGVFDSVGFNQESIEVCKKHKDNSTYSLSNKVKLLSNAITSFSSFPLKLSFVAGSMVSLISFCFSLYLFVKKLLHPELLISGWSSMMVSIWFLSGCILMSIGVIGIYLSKIYVEVKGRPLTIVKKVYKENSVG